MRQINLYANGEALDLLPDTNIVLTQQVNDIAELQDRQANYSNQFTLPKTTTNMRVLNDKHKKYPAQLEQYGALTNGFLVIQSEDSTYKAVFYSGVINFFQLIEGKKLKDLDLVSIDHILSATNIAASHTNDWNDGYIYPFINTANDDSVYDYTQREVWARGMMPCVYVRYLLEKIVESVEWKIEGKRIEEDKIHKAIVPVSYNNASSFYLKSKAETSQNLTWGGITNAFSLVYPVLSVDFFYTNQLGNNQAEGGLVPIPTNQIVNDDAAQLTSTPISYGSFNYFKPNGGVGGLPAATYLHKAKSNTLCDIRLDIQTFYAGSPNHIVVDYNDPSIIRHECQVQFPITSLLEIRLVAYSGVTPAIDSPHRLIKSWTYGTDYATHGMLSLIANDVFIYKDESIGIMFKVDNTQTTQFSTYLSAPYYTPLAGINIQTSSIEIYNTRKIGDETFPVVLNSYWGIADSLPDMTIKDFLKALAQRFCWIYDADAASQTLRVYSFQDIYDNIPYAKDWSDKVEAGIFNLDSHCNYAQFNDAVYSDDTAPKEYGNYFFLVNDNSLPIKKKSLECSFASTYFISRWNGYNMQHLPVWSDSYSSDSFFTTKPKAHILGVYKIPSVSVAEQIKIKTSAISYVVVQNNIPFAFFENVQNYPIDYEYTMQDAVENEYAALIRSLNNYEYITESVWLTPQDFIGFNPFIPVYIRKHQAYFYVNKITNFVEGKVTKVELLKLI